MKKQIMFGAIVALSAAIISGCSSDGESESGEPSIEEVSYISEAAEVVEYTAAIKVYPVTMEFSPNDNFVDDNGIPSPSMPAQCLYCEGARYWHSGLYTISQSSDDENARDLRANLHEIGVSEISCYEDFYKLLSTAECVGITNGGNSIYRVGENGLVTEHRNSENPDDNSVCEYRMWFNSGEALAEGVEDIAAYAITVLAESSDSHQSDKCLYYAGKNYWNSAEDCCCEACDNSAEKLSAMLAAIGMQEISGFDDFYKYVDGLKKTGITQQGYNIYEINSDTVLIENIAADNRNNSEFSWWQRGDNQ